MTRMPFHNWDEIVSQSIECEESSVEKCQRSLSSTWPFSQSIALTQRHRSFRPPRLSHVRFFLKFFLLASNLFDVSFFLSSFRSIGGSADACWFRNWRKEKKQKQKITIIPKRPIVLTLKTKNIRCFGAVSYGCGGGGDDYGLDSCWIIFSNGNCSNICFRILVCYSNGISKVQFSVWWRWCSSPEVDSGCFQGFRRLFDRKSPQLNAPTMRIHQSNQTKSGAPHTFANTHPNPVHC